MMKKNLSPALLEVIEKTVMSCGVELYDVEFKGKVLQVFITKWERISVDTCAKVSQALSLAFDMQNLIPSRYFLEVSSPGLERKLRNLKDFQASVGQTVSVKTKDGKLVGKIIAVTDNGVKLENIAGSCVKAEHEQFISINDINFARILISDGELFNEAKKIHKS